MDTKEPAAIYLIEVVFLIFLLIVVAAVSYYLLTSPNPAWKQEPIIIEGFIEAQQLKLNPSSDAVGITVQNTEKFENGVWSNNDLLLAYNVSANDTLSFSLPITEESQYQITIYLSKSYDYGIWSITVNGSRVAKADLYSAMVEPADPVDLGVHRLTPSRNSLSFEVVGNNAKAISPFFQFGMDGVALKRVNETP